MMAKNKNSLVVSLNGAMTASMTVTSITATSIMDKIATLGARDRHHRLPLF